MKCIRCECMLAADFPPLDEAGAYSLCETCFEAYLQERGWPAYDPDDLEVESTPRRARRLWPHIPPLP